MRKGPRGTIPGGVRRRRSSWRAMGVRNLLSREDKERDRGVGTD